MKLRKFHVLVLILVALIIGGAIWLFSRRPGGVTIDTYTEAAPAKADVPKAVVQAAPANQVELPKAAAVGAKAGTDAASVLPFDPHDDLKTAIPDIARLIRTGQGLFDYLTPEFLHKHSLDSARIQKLRDENAGLTLVEGTDALDQMRMIENQAKSYEALEGQAPSFNASHDEATYQYIMPPIPPQDSPTAASDPTPGLPRPLTFIRINGKWYIKADATSTFALFLENVP
jgi:hypothetical protein